MIRPALAAHPPEGGYREGPLYNDDRAAAVHQTADAEPRAARAIAGRLADPHAGAAGQRHRPPRDPAPVAAHAGRDRRARAVAVDPGDRRAGAALGGVAAVGHHRRHLPDVDRVRRDAAARPPAPRGRTADAGRRHRGDLAPGLRHRRRREPLHLPLRAVDRRRGRAVVPRRRGRRHARVDHLADRRVAARVDPGDRPVGAVADPPLGAERRRLRPHPRHQPRGAGRRGCARVHLRRSAAAWRRDPGDHAQGGGRPLDLARGHRALAVVGPDHDRARWHRADRQRRGGRHPRAAAGARRAADRQADARALGADRDRLRRAQARRPAARR